jgi:hypothetical protein
LKKFFALAFSALLILGFAASAFAIHAEIPAETTAAVATGSTLVTLGGNLRTRYEYCAACNTFDDDAHDNWKRWDTRSRMNFTIKVAENATGFVSWQNSWEWGVPRLDGAAGTYGTGNSTRGSTQTLQTWIQYTNLGPLNFKVGHMPLALGNHMFFSHTDNGDDALLIWSDPSPEVHLAYIYDLFDNGGSRTSSANAEAHVLLGTYSSDTLNLGGDVTWVNDNSALVGGELDLYNIALRGDATFGGVNVYADANFQSGEQKNGGTLGQDEDFGGYALMAGAKFKAGGMNLGAEFGLGSGDDDPTDGDNDTFQNSTNARVQYRTFIYSARTPTTAGADGAWTSNIMWISASAGGPITDALSFKAALYWLTAVEDTVICPTCTGAATADDEVGIEIDASVNYQLARNLRLWAEGGYLLAGDAFQKEDPVSGLVRSGDDAYGIRLGTEMSF